jgi:hypothetical protein
VVTDLGEGGPAETSTERVSLPSARRRHRRLLLLSAVLGVPTIVVILVLAAPLARPPELEQPVAPMSVAETLPAMTEEGSEPLRPEEPPPSVHEEPDGDTEVDGSPEEPRARKRVKTRAPPRKEPTRPSAETPPRPAPELYGWVRVGGLSLRRSSVELDGRRIGHAPLERRLKVGSYHLVARDPETSEVVFERNISVSEHHRRTSPLRVIR